MKSVLSLLVRLSFVLVMGVMSLKVYSQTEFRHNVKIRGEGIPKSSRAEPFLPSKPYALSKTQIYKVSKEETKDTLIVQKGFVLKQTVEKTSKDTVFEAKKESILTENDTIVSMTTKKGAERLFLPKETFKASLYTSEDTIYVNFWLTVNKRDKNGHKEKYTYYDASPAEKKYFFVTPDSKYFIKLNNRQSRPFYFTNWEIGALTIPLKYRPGFTRNEIDVSPLLDTEINMNLFVGYRMGRVSYTYDQHKKMLTNMWSVSVGGFVGLGTQKIDSISTSTALAPLTSEKNVPLLSYGAGAVFNLSDLSLGLFLGVDNGLGKTADKWDFDNRFWFGVGLGYKLSFLGKQE